jgi:bacteriorhodopsin
MNTNTDCMDPDLAFVEQTTFIIFLWVGVWGLIEHGLSSVSATVRTIVYCVLVVASCYMLYTRGHTKKLACL